MAEPLCAPLRRERGFHHGRSARRPPQRRGAHGAVRCATRSLHVYGIKGPRVLQPLHAARAAGRAAAAGSARADGGAAPSAAGALPGAREHEVLGHRLGAPAEVRRGHHGAERPRQHGARAGEQALHDGGPAHQGGARPRWDRARPPRHGHGHGALPAGRRRSLLRQGQRSGLSGPKAAPPCCRRPEPPLRRHRQRHSHDCGRPPANVWGPHGGRVVGADATGGGARAPSGAPDERRRARGRRGTCRRGERGARTAAARGGGAPYQGGGGRAEGPGERRQAGRTLRGPTRRGGRLP
mmetsp:Transcript_44840/g.138810  ORF Transcript_44840/g.138810 Transcript_44840/m.138810 type:complete len:296 (-) Transcript_44840:379-1266(-)